MRNCVDDHGDDVEWQAEDVEEGEAGEDLGRLQGLVLYERVYRERLRGGDEMKRININIRNTEEAV